MSINYQTKNEAVTLFHAMTNYQGELIHEEFIITGCVYTYSMYTENHVFTITLDAMNNQIVEKVYNKHTDTARGAYHNTRANVTRHLIELYNALKIERIGY